MVGTIDLLTAAHAWQAAALVVAIAAGLALRSYGRKLERQTREQGEQRPR